MRAVARGIGVEGRRGDGRDHYCQEAHGDANLLRDDRDR
jgi:hypothetical protein